MRLLSTLIAGVALSCAGMPSAAQQAAPARSAPRDTASAPPRAFAYLQGVALDSLHNEPLMGALIQVEGTARITATDSLGRFLIDSIPPGSHRLLVDHPVLDTIGILLTTPPMDFSANMITRTVIAIPGADFLAGRFCTPARRALGPGALVGRVREPDTQEPAVGARVSFVWYDPDIPGLPANLRMKKAPRVREAIVGEDGTYRLCGLPDIFEGKLQAQRKDGGETAEVTVSQSGDMLTLRSLSVAALPRTIAGDTGAVVPRGSARVFGRVLNANGAPVANARVGLLGASAATLTRANGDFVLDSLPSGTQALVVRQLGYRPTEVPVELSSRAPQRVTVKLGVFVPELSPVEVVSRRDEGLQKVGFSTRKRTSAGGYFLGTEQIDQRKATQFSDLLRTVPGLRVTQNSMGMATVSGTRGAGNGCVSFYVDGAQWQALQPGDLDSFVRPEDVAAVEVYNGAGTPAQFVTQGQNCSSVVVWTKTRVESRNR